MNSTLRTLFLCAIVAAHATERAHVDLTSDAQSEMKSLEAIAQSAKAEQKVHKERALALEKEAQAQHVVAKKAEKAALAALKEREAEVHQRMAELEAAKKRRDLAQKEAEKAKVSTGGVHSALVRKTNKAVPKDVSAHMEASEPEEASSRSLLVQRSQQGEGMMASALHSVTSGKKKKGGGGGGHPPPGGMGMMGGGMMAGGAMGGGKGGMGGMQQGGKGGMMGASGMGGMAPPPPPPSSCFPPASKVRVQLASGEVITKFMRELLVGDLVEVSSGKFESVLFFLHGDSEPTEYVRVTTAKGVVAHATAGHLIASGKPVGELRAGEAVALDDKVSALDSVTLPGRYHPVTASEKIVVDGFPFSTHSVRTMVGGEHERVYAMTYAVLSRMQRVLPAKVAQFLNGYVVPALTPKMDAAAQSAKEMISV